MKRNYKSMESLEERVSVFMDEHYYSNESDLRNGSSEEDLWWDENSSDSDDPPQRILYWESQLTMLQDILERYKLTGVKLRKEVGQIIKEVKGSDFCNCINPNSFYCFSCLRRQVVAMLRDRGFNTNLCLSKWENTKKFPGGSHEYIEVIASTMKRKKQIKFLIELEIKDQFQIAKAGQEYQQLASYLPEFYIGKPEYLTAVVRLMCDAAKKSMKENEMYIGPWRKSSFMQMKWSGVSIIFTSDNSLERIGTCPLTQAAPSVLIT